MTRPPIPVVVVAGFLGSGKTTLLNHLLRQGHDGTRLRIGVLVNDFGAVNIDALLVAGQADGAISLANGCMCCTVDRDGLESALGVLARPSAGLDAIVIEASGIAEPTSLIRMVTGLADTRLRYGGLAYLVDAATFGDVRATHPELDRHVAVADLVVVNKSDLAGPDELTRLRALIGELNPTAPTVVTVDAAIDQRLLFDAPAEPRATATDVPRQLALDELLAAPEHTAPEHTEAEHTEADHTADHPHRHLHDHYTSVAFETDEAMDPRRLAEFLRQPPAGCYRIKGITWFDLPRQRRHRYAVHAVGGFVRAHREPLAGDRPATRIVVIGTGIEPDTVRAGLAAALATPAGADDEYGILHITRHLPGA